VPTAIGEVPRVRTALGARDRLGTLKIRSAIGRSHYRVPPGLYAVGSPTNRSPVLLSANYKLSFDALRSVLGSRDAWILVLDTKGINVWCAAGKGTFGTAEIIRSVAATGLAEVVVHRRLVAPQLGAPGVAAHEVQMATGFRVVYGPVRAEDLPAFLDARMKASPEMRRMRFDLRDRLLLVPVELVIGLRYALPAAAVTLALGGLGSHGYSLANVATTGVTSASVVLASFVTAQVLGPALLPWLPGRAFALKGALLGMALAMGLAAAGVFGSWIDTAAWIVLVPAMTSFLLMNFTGASTFTSLSGVLREMRFAVPAQATAGALGLLLWLAGLWLSGGAAR
jgi:acetyl-CoA decarbonylase/synthase complex subunit gamma